MTLPADHADPARPSRRGFLIGAAFAAVSGAAILSQPRVANARIPNERFEKWVPRDFGPWSFLTASGVLLPPPDAMSDRLYDNLITRVYQAADTPPVMMLIAYNNEQNGVLQVHRPEVCYPAGGFVLTDTEPTPLPVSAAQTVPGNIFTATGPDQVEQVAYFTRLGRRFPRTWLDQRVAVAEANIERKIPDGALFRISVVDHDRAASVAILRRFLIDFFGVIPPQLQTMLVGRPISAQND